ncbi:MAG: hypothetical protein QF881_07915 [Acidimicrobiales bacterium]|nr:hypothetical protein [Acidimicrobiales bacterium]
MVISIIPVSVRIVGCYPPEVVGEMAATPVPCDLADFARNQITF